MAMKNLKNLSKNVSLVALAFIGYLVGAHWNLNFLSAFIHVEVIIWMLAAFLMVSFRFGVIKSLQTISAQSEASLEFKSYAADVISLFGFLGASFGLILTFGSIAAGPEVVGSKLAGTLVNVVMAGLALIWIKALPETKTDAQSSSSSQYKNLAPLAAALLLISNLTFAVLWIVGSGGN
jgi:flagellar motor component MotA